MKTIEDRQLTKHFRLYEFLEGSLPYEAISLNWKHINETEVFYWETMALELEKLRKLINENFVSDLGFPEIGIKITAGFRCKAWELFRKRSGNGQHTICAADIQPTNCTRIMAVEILKFVYKKYDPYWNSGLAICHPAKDTIGFVHIDFRRVRARWTY